MQQLYQVIKCISLRRTCHEGIQTTLMVKSLWWSKHIIKDIKHKRKERKGSPTSPLWLPAALDWEMRGSHFIFLGLSLLRFKTGGCNGGRIRQNKKNLELNWFIRLSIKLRLQENYLISQNLSFLSYNKHKKCLNHNIVRIFVWIYKKNQHRAWHIAGIQYMLVSPFHPQGHFPLPMFYLVWFSLVE